MPLKFFAPVLAFLRLQGGSSDPHGASVQVPETSHFSEKSSAEPKNIVSARMSNFLAPLDDDAGAKMKTPYAAELRRFTGNLNCSGSAYEVLNQDIMGECAQKLIPAPASIRVQYDDPTQYSSYHFQNNLLCGGSQKTKIGSFKVGECQAFPEDQMSQVRAWVEKKKDGENSQKLPEDQQMSLDRRVDEKQDDDATNVALV
eukprot:TRINITY_DN21270_c0_g2_i1.p1 TRINITY_DN21270_c0_g2~~TRINITY_DN21270_c0_g2_i1.p1  ORF type:complete len:201 (-),score=46.36 TRINITY_DN21270_c0_g2_i1:129-731(-)